MFVRFVVAERHPDSGHERGVFSALYDLEKRAELLPHELTWFHEAEAWLDKHLAPPSRLTRSARPGAANVAISWLKVSAVEHLRRMRDLAQLLEHHGVPVSELRTERPGYVVYEDDYQVAAIPFPRETFGPSREGG
ncbi:MAG TPA: hypothetical protein VJ650_12235 [Gemmatimonadaceae bacterium]|nr:hypothetical protein [Gemmatimonadaceae bacterium]